VLDDDAEVVAPRERGSSLAKRDPMALYLRETRRYPLLTPEEERDLATRLVEHGDSKAARKLIEANLRLVVKIAYEYRRAHKNCSTWCRREHRPDPGGVEVRPVPRGQSCRATRRSGSAHTS